MPAAAEPGEDAVFSVFVLVERGGEQPAEVLVRHTRRAEHAVGGDAVEDPA